MSVEALSTLMLTLQQDYGCHNINLVTPTHQIPIILKSLEIAIDAADHPPLDRRLTNAENRKALKTAKDSGLKRLD